VFVEKWKFFFFYWQCSGGHLGSAARLLSGSLWFTLQRRRISLCLDPHCGLSLQGSCSPSLSTENETGIDLVCAIGAHSGSSSENAMQTCYALHVNGNETWSDDHGCGSDYGHGGCNGSNPERSVHARHTRNTYPLGGKDVPGGEGHAYDAWTSQSTSLL